LVGLGQRRARAQGEHDRLLSEGDGIKVRVGPLSLADLLRQAGCAATVSTIATFPVVLPYLPWGFCGSTSIIGHTIFPSLCWSAP
jgi:hypothetical protein